jgi:hypothetical protein
MSSIKQRLKKKRMKIFGWRDVRFAYFEPPEPRYEKVGITGDWYNPKWVNEMSSIKQRTKAKRMRMWGWRQLYTINPNDIGRDFCTFVGYTNDWHDTEGWGW